MMVAKNVLKKRNKNKQKKFPLKLFCSNTYLRKCQQAATNNKYMLAMKLSLEQGFDSIFCILVNPLCGERISHILVRPVPHLIDYQLSKGPSLEDGQC